MIEELKPFLIGAAGGLVTALKFTPGGAWYERLFNIICGALAAGFTAPALRDWMGFSTDVYLNATAFIVGLLGMSVADSVLKAIKDGLISRWLGRKVE